MKPCPCGSPATWERPIPWDPIRLEGVCQECADRLTDALNRQQARLDARRPRPIPPPPEPTLFEEAP